MKQRIKLIDNPQVKVNKEISKTLLEIERAHTQTKIIKETRVISSNFKLSPVIIPILPIQTFPVTSTTLFLIYIVDEDNQYTSQEMWTDS